MDQTTFAWRILDALAKDYPARSPLAPGVLKWVRDNQMPLNLRLADDKRLSWRKLGARAAKLCLQASDPAQPRDALHGQCARIAEALRLDQIDAELLWFVVAADRFDLVRSLCKVLDGHQLPPALYWAGRLAAHGGEARRRLAGGELTRLGLIEPKLSKEGRMTAVPSWTLNRLLNRTLDGADDPVELLAGQRQQAALGLGDFARVGEDADLIVRLLRGALASRSNGVNVLLYGPPGTGKTELARALSAAAGGELYSVGEADEDGEEPSRWDRVNAYRLAQRVALRRPGMVLLFDEMEDLIGDSERGNGDFFRHRSGSKLFVNRLLEANDAPTIWTTNAIGNVDPAILRRMGFVLKLDYPAPRAAEAILARIAADEGLDGDLEALRALSRQVPEATTVLRGALASARIAGGGEADAQRTAQSLLAAVRGGERVRIAGGDPGQLDLALYETDRDIAALVERVTCPTAPADFSLLLTGPPGTGKTVLAHHLAHRLDRPLIVKRASELFSKWVGGTERQIRMAFEEALDRSGVLLFDEVDSLLLDRSQARQSWEVSQVNELLTWFDDHPLPFIAATNHGDRLDAAALRRFVFKLDFRALSGARLGEAWARFFPGAAPIGLTRLAGLTPGDFAVVARQLRFDGAAATPEAILASLEAELRVKPGQAAKIGF